jgi:hypothetical protein
MNNILMEVIGYARLSLLVGSVRPLQDLEQEPRAAFRLIEDLLQRIARGRVKVLVAHGNRLP